MAQRKLSLRKDTLAELTSDDLAQVIGGQQSIIPTCVCTGYYPSLNAPCHLPTTTNTGE
jgi:hypothetical protein